MAETTTLTIRVGRATRDELERIARSARRSKSFVASEVLDTFFQDQAWYAAKIEAARKSKLVPDAEMNRLFRELEGEGPLARKRTSSCAKSTPRSRGITRRRRAASRVRSTTKQRSSPSTR